MALRMVTYTVLLYEELVRRNELTENGLLPPVLSLVLYNGRGQWREALSLDELVEPLPGIPGVDLPKGLSLLSFELIDAQRYSPEELEAQKNAVAAFFQIEQSRDLQDLLHGASKLREVLAGEELRSLQQAALTWLLSRMEKLVGPGVSLPQIHEWTEVESMLEQSVLEWRDSWFQEGRQEGRQEGEATVLLHLLAAKFGVVPQAVNDRILSASTDQLLAWAKRVLSAKTIDQVFG